MSRRIHPNLLAALLAPVLVACGSGDSPAAATDPASRIIAKEVANAQASEDTKGIDLVVDGTSFHASTAMQTGFRNSGEGHLMLSIQANRVDGQELFLMKTVVHQLVPEHGTQTLGDGTSQSPYMEITGVPGHGNGPMRSVEGEVSVSSLILSESNLPTEGDATFTGLFVPADGAAGATADAQPVKLSGRIRFKSDW